MRSLTLVVAAGALGGVAVANTFGTVRTLVGGASDLVLDEGRGRLYLVNSASNRIEVWSIAQNRYLNSIRTDARPLAAAMPRNGKLLYVTAYDQSSLNVIDLDTSTVIKRVNLAGKPEAVAVGGDGRVLITTIGTGQNNQFNTLLVYDPNAAVGTEITPVAITLPPAAAPVPPPLGRPAYSTQSGLIASNDGRYIIGVNNVNANSRYVFVYEAVSSTVLRARTVNSVSNVLSVSPDGSKFMAGLTLFETATLSVLAQQNAANAPFSFPAAATSNFNTQQNQGGSIFSPDGQTLYSAFNIAPVQSPAARPNVSRLLLNDPDNLLITLGLQLPENLAGRMVISADGGTIYALSESGFLVIPVNQMNLNPIAVPESLVVALANDQCGVVADKRSVSVNIANTGRGRLTATAMLLQAGAVAGLGGAGGAGGGGAGGGIVIIVPPGQGGIATPPGVTPGANVAAGTAQTSPQVATQNTASGTTINYRFNPVNARSLGTVTPHNFLIQSNEAINIPANVKVFQNNRDTEARGDIAPVAVNASDQEGLFDMLLDSQRNRIYIANSGMNRVEVFDIRTKRYLAPIKVGQLPHSMAFGTDGVTLYVANSGSEVISIVDLDRGRQTGLVHFPPLPFNSNAVLATPQVIAGSQRGPQVIVSAGANQSTLWKIVGTDALPRTLNPVVFGTARTLPGPSQTMVSTPGGEYTMLLAGNGFAYLYDASVDEWVIGRQVFANNVPSLSPLTGYFGPVAAGPRGQYFIANGTVMNSSLTPVSAISTDPTGGGLPGRGGATATTPIAAVSSGGNTTFARLSMPTIANAAQLTTLQQTPMVEVVDVTTGQTTRTAPALEGPLAVVLGNQTQRINGRTMALDAAGTTAYVLTASGLSIVPLIPVAAADRPVLPAAGVVNIASYLPQIAPGSLISMFGRGLGANAVASSATLPTTLGGSCVTLNNNPLPLLMTSDGQVNAQIPPELAPGRYPLVARSIDRQASSPAQQITIARYAPAVFTGENSQPALYHADGRLVTKQNPARRDEPLRMYATGLGATTGGRVTSGTPSPASPLAVTQKVQVYFGDPRYKQSEVIVDWSGLAPGMIGVYQLNLRVPGFHGSGQALPVTLKIGGVTSPTKGPAIPLVAVD